MSVSSDDETKHSFCLNFGENKFEKAYDLTNSKQLAKQANGRYSMKLFTTQNIATKEFFAVKKVSASRSEFLDNTWKELNAIISIKDHKSENLIKYHEAFLYDKPAKNQNEGKQVIIIVMELGEYTLYDKIKYGLEENDAYQKLQETLKGIECLKKNNIYHRDIKPHNLVVKNNQVKIIDLNVRKNTPYAKTQKVTEKFGTKIYMDPRLRFLDVNFKDENYYLIVEKSDLYSVGLTFAQLALKMNKDYYRDWKLRMDNYVLYNKKNQYEKELKEELDQINHQELKHILKNLLCFRVEDRWNLSKALGLEEPILVEEEKEKDEEEEQQKYLEEQNLQKPEVAPYQCQQENEKKNISLYKKQNYRKFIQEYGNLDKGKISNNYKSVKVDFKYINQEQRMNVISIISEKFQSLQDLSLDFYYCQVKPDQMIQLLDKIKEIKSEISLEMDLSNKKIEDKITGQLFQAIQSIPKLVSLTINLDYNKISSPGAESIADAIKQLPSLTTLGIYLGSNQISIPGAGSIADAIKQLLSLTGLANILGINQISSPGAESIADAIKQLPSLSTLYIDLSSNEISNPGAQSIADAIKQLPFLTTLCIYLSFNQISNPGAQSIAGAIKQLPSLANLCIDLCSNKISNPGAESIADGIKQLPTLATLDIYLSYNQISNPGAKSIADAIKQLPSLNSLYLNFNSCEPDDVEENIKILLEGQK